MKFAKWLIIAVAAILGIFVVITFFLPKDYYVERSIEIEAPAFLIFANVADLEAWQTWNPWNEMDPDIEITFGEKTVGTGASYTWVSEKMGGGEMLIVLSKAPEVVRYQLTFEGYEETPGYSDMLLKAESATGPTIVTWTFEGDTGDKFFSAWMSLFMDTLLGPSYEDGLAKLKEKCEKQIQVVPGMPLP